MILGIGSDIVDVRRIERYDETAHPGRTRRTWRAGVDERGHRVWLRYVNRVTARDLDDARTRALRHETLGRRRDHLVVSGHQVPARLGLPRWLADRAAERFQAPGDLRIGHECSSLRVHVSRE